jgi:uncharacterized repeat protein (TIGR03806 family)
VVVAGALLAATAAAAEPLFGLSHRVPYTSSRLVGSPDPPPPYTVEKTFTKLTWKKPIYIAAEPGTDRLWIVEESVLTDGGSRVRRITDDPAAGEAEVLLELPKRLAYSVCFHPDYPANGHVYLFSNGPRDASKRMNRVARYTVGRQSPYRIDPSSEELVIEWESAGHDGGDMAFGPGGLFYITTGDGTSDSDAWNSGQTLDDLLGSVLRIDVNRHDGGRAYAVPADNPFVRTPGARAEIWAYGLRNPWRMCADPPTGQVWVGNNGQDLWETAHLVRRGENYGWSVYEGSHPFYLNRKLGPTPVVPPTIEHSHAEFRSLTGGVVYRGDKLPDLDGAYIYGDYSTGRVWGMKHDGQKPVWHRELARTTLQIAGFRVDHRGDLLIADHGGGIYRLVPTPPTLASSPFPTLLSRTGLFASTRDHRPDPGLVPYSVNAPGWADGSTAERFLAVPGDAKVGFETAKGWAFPDGTALVQTLSLGRVRVETRVLLRQHGEWAGYSYRWTADQTDAAPVPAAGDDAELAAAGGPPQKWRFPSRAECMTCHSRAAGFVLGVTGAQLNREHDYGGVRDNQLRALDHVGFFTKALPKAPKDLDRLADPADAAQDLERRARAYLHVNCSVCHVEAGGGNAKMELGLATPREKMNLLAARPQHDTFGIADAMLVAPGAPDRSVLLHRLARRGPGQMPPLVTNRVDESAVRLFRDWIAGLKPALPFVRDWQMEELLPDLEQLKTGRSLDAGRKAFGDTGCAQCHRFEGQGGTVGPDLAGVGRRLKAREVLESILLPSKVIADGYADTVVETARGTVVTGRIEREDDRVLVLRPPSGEAVTVPKKEIVDRRKSDVSNMPPGIVNVLQKDQVLDLVAYLLSDPVPEKEKK